MELVYLSSGPRERVLEALLCADHVVTEVIVTDPVRFPRVQPTVDLALERGLPVRILRRRVELSDLAADLAGLLVLSVGFGWLLPPGVITAARICLNVHGTLLPEFAGARTLNWVIASGADSSGVTVHQIDDGVDTGPILLQRQFAISRFDTVRSLQRKTLELEPSVVLEALELVECGSMKLSPQDRSNVRRWPDRRPADSEIDPTRPLIELYDKIRAADSERFPAYFIVEGERVGIRLWRPDKPEGEDDLV